MSCLVSRLCPSRSDESLGAPCRSASSSVEHVIAQPRTSRVRSACAPRTNWASAAPPRPPSSFRARQSVESEARHSIEVRRALQSVRLARPPPPPQLRLSELSPPPPSSPPLPPRVRMAVASEQSARSLSSL